METGLIGEDMKHAMNANRAKLSKAPLPKRVLSAVMAIVLVVSLAPNVAAWADLDNTADVQFAQAAEDIASDGEGGGASPEAAVEADGSEDGTSASAESTDDDVSPASQPGEIAATTASADSESSDEPAMVAAADATTIDISTYDQLIAAFKQTQDTPGEYVFNLMANVEISRTSNDDDRSVKTGSTVTIYGNGHKLTGVNYGLMANGGTLNLGTADGAHGTLTIQVNNDAGTQQVYGPALRTSLYGGGVINMYAGTAVTGVANSQGIPGVAVMVYGGTFNMYGGSISRCNNQYSGGAVATLGTGTFNMYGGEISDNRSTSTISNTRQAGAGVHVGQGTFNLIGGTICRNTAYLGAGVYVEGNGTFNMSGGTVSENTAASDGGGIYNNGGTLSISGTASITLNNASTDTRNASTGYGGGIYATGYSNKAGSVTISGGSITDNIAQYGAGIWNRTYSTVNMTNGTISANKASWGGGGVGNVGTFNMSGGTITQNSAADEGGGIYANMNYGGGTGGVGAFKMTGGAVHNNTAVDGADIAAQVTDSDHLQLVDASGMNATLSRSGLPITGWYEDGKYSSAGRKVANSNWSNTDPTHYVDHSSDYNTTTDWYGALYLIAAHGPSDSATVTFRVVGGKWSDNTTADKTVILNSAGSMNLASSQIPSGTANAGYGNGTWSVSATSGTAPTSATPNTTHTFAAGDNIVYTLTFTPNQHKVTYVYDGTVPTGADAVPAEKTYAYGTTVDVENLPTLDGYRFSGWTTADADIRSKTMSGLAATSVASNQVFTMPDKDVTLHGQWIKRSTITFDTDGGSSIDPMTGDAGSAVTPPANPTKDGYDFAGWEPGIPGTFPENDTTVKAKWTPKNYTIKFVNYDGTELQSGQVPYDTMPAYSGSTPTKPADAQYTYTFAGWTPTIEKVTGDKTYTATFTPTPRAYTVTWVGDNGVELEKDVNVPYGATPSYDGATPTKPGYIFAGWTPTVSPVTGDVTYTARFVPGIVATYTVTWVDEDGTLLERDSSVPAGTMPAYDGATPTKVADAEYTYAFAGWTPAVTLVTGDAVYRATYTKTPIVPPTGTHTVSFDANGGSPVDSQTIESGQPVAKPADPTRAGYTFKGWQLDGKDYDFAMPVTGDIKLVAVWEAVPAPAPAPADDSSAKPGKSASRAAASSKLPTTGDPLSPLAPCAVIGAALACTALLVLRRRDA